MRNVLYVENGFLSFNMNIKDIDIAFIGRVGNRTIIQPLYNYKFNLDFNNKQKYNPIHRCAICPDLNSFKCNTCKNKQLIQEENSL